MFFLILPAWFFNIIQATITGNYWWYIQDFATVSLLSTAAFATRLHLNLRAYLFLGVFFAEGVFWLVVSGLPGAGHIHLFIVIVFAAFILEKRDALFISIASLLAMGGVFLGFSLGWIPLPLEVLNRTFSPAMMAVNWAVQALASVALIITIFRSLNTMQEALRNAKTAKAKLQRFSQELEVGVDERTKTLQQVSDKFMEEILRREQAEEALREKEDLLRETQQAAQIGGWRYFPATGKVHWTEEMYRLYRLDPSMTLTFDYVLSFHPRKARRQISQAHKHMLETGEPYDVELPFVRADGEHRWMRAHGKPVYQDGRIEYILGTFQDITERKQAEEALRHSEEHFRVLAETATDIIFRYRFEPETACEYISPAITSILGYTPEEFYANPNLYAEISFSESQGEFEQLFVLGEDYPRFNTNKFISKERRVVWLEQHVQLTFDENGKPILLQGIARDVTERVRAEEALRKSQKRLERGEAVAHLGSWELDLATGKSAWSDEFFRICGLEPGSVEPTSELGVSLIHPDDRERAAQTLQNAIAHRAPYAIEKRIVRPSGDVRWVQSVGEIECDEHQQPKMLIGAFLDITERKQTEEALRENQILLQGVLDYAPVLIYAKDLKGQIILANRQTEILLGQEKGAMLGKTDFDFHPPDIAAHNWEIDLKVQELQHPVEDEEHALGVDGEIETYLTIKFPLLDDQERVCGTCGISSNITERKKMEQWLQEAKEAAETANRAKSEFLANMSHEIRTPMNAVIGMTNLLLETPLNAEQLDYVQTVRLSGDTLLTLINDILDFSKIEAGKLDIDTNSFNLRSCIEDSLELLAMKAAEKDLTLSYWIEEDVPEQLLGDVTRVRQILVNLLSNAVKFTEQGEVSVYIEAHAIPNTVSDIPEHILEEGQEQPEKQKLYTYHLSVTDTGIGIPADRLDRLFESFSQADSSITRKYGGTGLGLAISKRLAEMMGGTIWVESTEGQGSTFHITFTAEVLDEVNMPSSVFASHEILNGKRVLIVDDNPTNCRVIEQYVLRWGMTSCTVGSGAKALELLNQGELFDVAVLDMRMPDMDGIRLAQRIHRDIQHTIPLILWTSMMMRREMLQEAAADITTMLVKPVRPLALRNTLINIFQGTAVFNEDASTRSGYIDTTMGKAKPLRILLAEDNVINQKVALRLLEKMGYRADISANGLEVLDALNRQQYDVILMDVQMPEMDGLEATRQIRELEQDGDHKSYIIAMTAHAMQGDRQWCIEAGMNNYISKPVWVEELESALEQAVQKILPKRLQPGEPDQPDEPASSNALAVPGDPSHNDFHEEVREVGGGADTSSKGNTSIAVVADSTADDSDDTSVDTFDTVFDNINVVDEETFQRFVKTMGTELAPQLVKIFLEELPGKISTLQQALADGDCETIHQIAHAMKSSSAQLGMLMLSRHCQELEANAKVGDIGGSSPLVAQIVAQSEQAEHLLEEKLGIGVVH
jgi:PAS domain S-box-containing protein